MDLHSGLSSILPEDQVLTSGEELERHGRAFFTFFTSHSPHPLDVVVFPKSRNEVVQVLRFANEHGIHVIPFRQGSSLEGHTIPRQGGISLDTRLMDEFLHPPGSRRRSRTTEEVNAHIVVYTLARGGTSTGEHGVGFGKMKHLEIEHGDSLQFMRAIKKLADPNGIMNPGTVLAADEREVPEKSC